MNKTHRFSSASIPILAVVSALAGTMPAGVRADVVVEEQSTFDFSIIKAHGNTTELTTSDKQRRDNAFHCEGFMSLLCGNAESAEIIRLDRDVEWNLEPKKKEYRETAFMTAAQRQAAMQEAQATLEKMKQCPAPPQSTAPAPNTSKCQMSPPKFDANQTDTHAMLLGHDARLTQISMTQSCTNPETGDTCDLLIGMDAWLTQEQIAGLEDRRAFQQAYLRKLGLGDAGPLVQKQMRQFLAPYAESLQQLAGKAGDLKGFPLKTAVRIAFGGERCAAAQKQQSAAGGGDGASTAQAPPQSSTGLPSGASLGSVASSLGGKLVGGLFAKKKQEPAPSASPLPPGMVQAAQFTVETTAITPGPIAPTQFDIPAGWKLISPPAKTATKEFTCPKTG
jgi:hypothetical protein